MNGRKIFGSGAPGANVLMTTGIYDDPTNGPTVINFPVPMNAPGVTVLDTWRVLGMRGTGSQDIELKDVFVPEAVTQGVRRPAGKWHPAVHVVCLIALPIVYSAYLGVAENARDLALAAAKKRKEDPSTAFLVGDMEAQLVTAQAVLADAVALARAAKPGAETSVASSPAAASSPTRSSGPSRRRWRSRAAASFYRSATLERLFRDVQAGRYHPMPDRPRERFTGRVLLGLDIDG